MTIKPNKHCTTKQIQRWRTNYKWWLDRWLTVNPLCFQWTESHWRGGRCPWALYVLIIQHQKTKQARDPVYLCSLHFVNKLWVHFNATCNYFLIHCQSCLVLDKHKKMVLTQSIKTDLYSIWYGRSWELSLTHTISTNRYKTFVKPFGMQHGDRHIKSRLFICS